MTATATAAAAPGRRCSRVGALWIGIASLAAGLMLGGAAGRRTAPSKNTARA